MIEIPVDIERKLKAVIRKIEEAVAFDGVMGESFNASTSLKTLSRLSGMSERSLRDWFKSYTGESVSHYAGKRRAEYAARILRLFSRTSKSKVAEIIGLNSSQALYPFMRRNGVEDIDGLRTPCSPIDCQSLSFRFEKIDDCTLFYTLNEANYMDCSAAEFEMENWNKIDEFVKAKYPEAIKIGDVGFAIDRYIENKQEEGIFISGILCENISQLKLPNDMIGDIGWKNIDCRKYAVFSHKGGYEGLSKFYLSALQSLGQRNDLQIEKSLLIMEKYLNSPIDTPDKKLITEIWVPIR